MYKIGVIVFVPVQVQNILPYLLRCGRGRLSPSVPMDKCSLSFFFVGPDQPVYLPLCDSQGQGSSVFVSVLIHKLFYNFIFSLFSHP